jgi:hypothetical protein
MCDVVSESPGVLPAAGVPAGACAPEPALPHLASAVGWDFPLAGGPASVRETRARRGPRFD